MSPQGGFESFVTACGGRRFVFLNDLAFAPNGDLYVTDSGIELETLAPGGVANPNYRALDYDGRVYRVDIAARNVDLIDRGLQFSNGLAFGPDCALYVNETLTGNIYRYEFSGGRISGPRETFANVIERFDPGELKGPDGMKFGANGCLYVAVFGQGDITVVGRRGEIVDRLETGGTHPTNLAFGPPGSKQIYVTEMQTGTMQIMDVGTDGLPLHG
jgi:gluconolactonase